MKSFSLCHEIIPPVVLKSFGLSQDLPLSQNGQNFRRKKSMEQWADWGHYATWKRPVWPSRLIGLIETNCRISTSYQFSRNLTFTENALFSPGETDFFVLFGTLKSKNGQNRAFLVFSSLNHFISIFCCRQGFTP